MRLIKKYKNRRLYDTETSKYITIEELERYTVEGILFRVEDAASGKDITNNTLLQILVEMEAGPTQFLSTDLLRQLINLARHPMHETFKSMLEQTMALMEKQFRENPYFNSEATKAWNEQMQQFISQWQNFFRN
ncbi:MULTISPECIES: polyhydroxyalkanoate synthesis regulator DNA-binding domain-containing protein [Legionella]|uniref:polyhydroxyalkanoate synthesis regulator DNA-binding domain-containing protein n=1 Tax=Legionella TaxID=445 RepID=UPI000F8F3CD9|nr:MULTISPECIES: polyhydroxyalkanoate synthesis regulator DNA-binding domain-containing protein [Legionella]MCP0913950.1 polyhydroxyalkanoate biosynthesis repressor PhaR [Legionella sp. 27cVA30]RUR00040.1 polyhydroxyalkanoate biosynthesis repressor PhaR [Legionella septentrionalis]RUR10736.1 polyhydroxyalkanoate biosynthesis repressor PhaR [Legionella septentrionalis]RUR16511.1 polyhydroxyalkanoate biosynthesis repressor PhaR [Legionella septentrionalis]